MEGGSVAANHLNFKLLTNLVCPSPRELSVLFTVLRYLCRS
jgi:hypothetical protein